MRGSSGTLPVLYGRLFTTLAPIQLNGRASDPCVKPWGCDRTVIILAFHLSVNGQKSVIALVNDLSAYLCICLHLISKRFIQVTLIFFTFPQL